MHQSELDDAVRHVVAERLHLAPERLTLDSDLDDLGLDDEAAASVLTGVEDALEVRFPDDFFDGLRTYGDLTAAVRVAVGA